MISPPSSLRTPMSSQGRLRVAMFVVLAVGVLNAALFIDVVDDDAFITFRYAQRLADGKGPSFNDDERTEGYTNFSWMIAIAAYLHAGGTQALGVAKAMGILAALLSIVLLRKIARDLIDSTRAEAWALAVALALALSGDASAQAMSGLETSLHLACTLGALWSVHRERGTPWRSALWLALGVLTRPEALGTALILSAVDAWDRRAHEPRWWRIPLMRLALLFALLIPYAIWKFSMFGTLVPNTFVAKHVPLSAIWWTAHAWPALRDALGADFGWGAAIVLAIAGAWNRRDRVTRMVAALAIFYVIYATWVGVDTLPGGRFYLPAFVLMLPLAAEGVRRLPRAIAIGLLIISIFFTARADRELHQLMTGITERLYGVHGEIVREVHRRSTRVIALRDIGLIGWYLPEVRIVDLAGLTDRRIAALPGALGEKAITLDDLLARDVGMLVANAHAPPASDGRDVHLGAGDFSPTLRGIVTDSRFVENYSLVRSLPFSADHHLYLFVRRPPRYP